MMDTIKKNGLLLVSSNILNRFAETIFYLSIIWYIYDITKSSIATAFYSIIAIASNVIIGPIIGVFSERKKPKAILSYSFAIISIIGVILSILFYLEISYLIIFIYLFTMLHAIFLMASNVSRGRLIGEIIPQQNIPKISGYITSFGSIADMVGNALAGFVLITVGYAGIILMHSGSYLLSVILIFFILVKSSEYNLDKPLVKQRLEDKPKNSFLKELLEGLKEFRSNKPVFKLIIIGSMVNILSIGSALIVVLIYEHFNAGPREYGLFHAAGTFSLIVVGLLASKFIGFKRPGIIFSTCLLIVGLSMLLISFTTNFWLGTLWFMLIAGAEVLMLISINSMLIILVQEAFRARVMSLAMSISNLFMPVGILFNSIVAEYFAIKYVYIIVGSWVLFWALFSFLNKDIRNLSFHTDSNEVLEVESPSI
ncbi:MFS transporter [Solibacillus sp.]|uniref:MFS transporter n=1 Tax=Solibacillus sp. TaxID=1909654 RepID=UPI0033161990